MNIKQSGAPWINDVELIDAVSAGESVPADLICAIGMKESGWNPEAIRYEPSFYRWLYNPLDPRVTNDSIKRDVPAIGRGIVSLATEKHARAFSWGVMQVMGQVARERGFSGAFLSSLLDPALGIPVGARYLGWQLRRYDYDLKRAISAYNAGSAAAHNRESYVEPVLKILAKIRLGAIDDL